MAAPAEVAAPGLTQAEAIVVAAEAPATLEPASGDVPPATEAPGSAAKSSLLNRVGSAVREGAIALRDKAAASAELVKESTMSRRRLSANQDAGDGAPLVPVEAQEPKEASTQGPKVTSALLEAAAGFSRRTREGGQAAYQAAITSIRRLTAPSRRVAAICKADLRTKPVPQVLLLTCNLVASKGLTSPGLFQDPTDPAVIAQVQSLAARLEDRLLLLPADLEPVVASAIIKHFLASLEEPLLTYRLVDRWVAAGKAVSSQGEGPEGLIHELLAELPLVNWSTLNLLMETCYRVASQWNITGKNAYALASSLAPALLWYESAPAAPPAATSTGSATSQGVVSQASQMATGALQALRSKLMPTTAAAGDAGSSTGSAGDAAVPTSEGGATDGVQAASPTKAAAEAVKPHVVLDEQEEAELGADTALEKTVVQHGDSDAATSPKAAPAAAPGVGAAAQQGSDGGGKNVRAPLVGESLDAAVTLLEHLILNFDDLFMVST